MTIKTYTLAQIKANPRMLVRDLPIRLSVSTEGKRKVVAEVVPVGAAWRVCENCGVNTQGQIRFKIADGEYKGQLCEIILCPACEDKLRLEDEKDK